MFRYCVYLSLLALAAAQGYNYASASAPEPEVLQAPFETAPTIQVASTPVAAASQHHMQQVAPAPVYRKHYYFFSAPAESDVHRSSVAPAVQPAPVVKKHLNMIFIKAPESAKSRYQPLHTSVSYVIEKPRIQISVLNTEPSRYAPRPAASQQHATTYHSQQPEVHHLTYKTAAEAQQLQQQIVQQYGGGNVIELGGHEAVSNVNRQYLAPDASNVNNQYLAPAVEAAAASVPEPSNAYIPPSVFFKH